MSSSSSEPWLTRQRIPGHRRLPSRNAWHIQGLDVVDTVRRSISMPVVRIEAVREGSVDNDIDVRAPQRCYRLKQQENGVGCGSSNEHSPSTPGPRNRVEDFFTFLDLRRKRRDSEPTRAHDQYWNVYGLTISPLTAGKERTSSSRRRKLSNRSRASCKYIITSLQFLFSDVVTSLRKSSTYPPVCFPLFFPFYPFFLFFSFIFLLFPFFLFFLFFFFSCFSYLLIFMFSCFPFFLFSFFLFPFSFSCRVHVDLGHSYALLLLLKFTSTDAFTQHVLLIDMPTTAPSAHQKPEPNAQKEHRVKKKFMFPHTHSSQKDKRHLHVFGNKMRSGRFVGYALHTGGRWSGDVLIHSGLGRSRTT